MPRTLKTITLNRISLAASDGVTVDTEAHVIHNVAIIQKGEALGHDFEVDDVMLQQVFNLVSSKPKGVKSRLTHPGLTDCGGYDGIETMLGRVKATGIVGDKVRGDLYLGGFATKTPAGDLRSYIEAIALEDPELIGISISFEPDEFVERPATPNANPTLNPDQAAPLPLGRVKDVMAADLVGDPAANRDGLLSRLPAKVLSSIPQAMLSQWMDVLSNLTKLTNGGESPPEVTNKEPSMNPKLLAALVALGLSATATEETARKMLANLNSQAKKRVLAEAGEPDPTPAPAPADTDPANMGKFCSQCGGTLGQGSKFCATCGSAIDPPAPPAALSHQPKNQTDLAAEAHAKRLSALKQICTLAKLGEDWLSAKTLGLADAVDPEEFVRLARAEGLKKLSGDNQPVHVSVGVDQNLASLQEAVSDAIMLRSGHADKLLKQENGRIKVLGRNAHGQPITERREAHPRAQKLQYMSMTDLANLCLQAEGVNTEGLSKPQIARLALNRQEIVRRTGNVNLYASTGDFSNILADMVNKGVGAGFQLAPDTTYWCRSRPLPDFKQAKTVKLSAAPKLSLVTPGANYQTLNFADQGESYYLAKYGNVIIFDWETLINDDLNVFAYAPIAQGMAAKATKLDVVYTILTTGTTTAIKMADGVVLFHSTHGNVLNNSLGLAGWAAVKAAMGKQTSNGQLINNLPKYLLIPMELEADAANIVLPNAILGGNSTTVTTQQNPYAGKVETIVEQRLSVNSSTAWYAASDPGMMDTVEIGTLEGEPEPVVEQEQAFDFDGRKLKVRYTVAAKAADYRGLCKGK